MIKKIHPYYVISITYMIISVFLGTLLNDGLIIFLAWNMFLATCVFAISRMLIRLYYKQVKHWILMIGFLCWIIFFPNSIYMLTDFIHFQNYTFFFRYADVYNYTLQNWIVFAHVVIGALFAAKLGVMSIKTMEVELKSITKSYYSLMMSFIFLVSSIGIFIGRFLRFNSWDILNIFDITKELIVHEGFFIGFVTIFFILHWFMYFIFSNDYKNHDCKSIKQLTED